MQAGTQAAPAGGGRAAFGVALALLLATLLVFRRVAHDPFIAWDDDIHTYANPLLHPVSAAHLGRLWTHPYEQLFIPVSYSVFALLALLGRETPMGETAARPDLLLDPHVFHAANLLIHGANVLLVFALLRRCVPRSLPAAAAGALLFALHPVQVESVAWISETRGTLCGLFSLLALRQYLSYADGVAAGDTRRARLALLAATLTFVLALLCKPAAVAVPLMAWILARSAAGPSSPAARDRPLLGWALLSAVIVLVTRAAQPVPPELSSPLWARPLIAGDALAFYLEKLVLPTHLAPDYGRTPAYVLSHPAAHWTWLIPVGLALAAWRFRRRAPWLPASLALFAAWLLPVLGLVPFTFQTYSTVADRYLYLALLGPALALAALLGRFPNKAAWGLCAVGLALCAWGSMTQVRYWDDSAALFRRTLTVNPQSWTALDRLGQDADAHGHPQEAVAFYRRALAVSPDAPFVQDNLGKTLTDLGDLGDAVPLLRQSVRRLPGVARAHYNLGRALELQGQTAEAVSELSAALRLQPAMPLGWNNLGVAWVRQGRTNDAVACYRHALDEDPHFRDARFNLGNALAVQGDTDGAVACYQQVIAEHGPDPDAEFNLGALLCRGGRIADAIPALQAALQARPGDAPAHYYLGVAQATLGDAPAGLAQCREALRLDPTLSDARRVIALILAHTHKEAPGIGKEAPPAS